MKKIINFLNDPVILLFVSPIVILPLAILVIGLGMNPMFVVILLAIYIGTLLKAISK